MASEYMSDRNMLIGMGLLVVLLAGCLLGGFALIDAADHRHERRQLERCLQRVRDDRVVCAVVGVGS